jgi:hypothetical protein
LIERYRVLNTVTHRLPNLISGKGWKKTASICGALAVMAIIAYHEGLIARSVVAVG